MVDQLNYLHKAAKFTIVAVPREENAKTESKIQGNLTRKAFHTCLSEMIMSQQLCMSTKFEY